jgi:metal-responsive CopG/Arc/MetJ family transcriptional regulator
VRTRIPISGGRLTSVIREYDYLVRVKTSITLPEGLLRRLDRVGKNRSALIERATLAYLTQMDRQARDRKDIEIINRNAERLNREAMDTLEYQQLP